MTTIDSKCAQRTVPQGIVEPPGQWSSDRPSQVEKPVGFHPERVPEKSRLAAGGRLLSDERLRWIEIVLDEAFVVPGTGIRFGLDGIIGLIPGLGDVLAAVLSLAIPMAAWVRGVPYVTLIRMLMNVSIGLLVGTVPIFGDIFDVFWKANRRNYLLLTRSLSEPHRHTWRDWLFLALLGLAIMVVFAIPVVLLIWLAAKLAYWQPVR